MSNKNIVKELHDTRRVGLDDVLAYIDELHNAAADDQTEHFSGMTKTQVMNYLRDIIYTAQEAMHEIDATRGKQLTPILRIVEKIDKAG